MDRYLCRGGIKNWHAPVCVCVLRTSTHLPATFGAPVLSDDPPAALNDPTDGLMVDNDTNTSNLTDSHLSISLKYSPSQILNLGVISVCYLKQNQKQSTCWQHYLVLQQGFASVKTVDLLYTTQWIVDTLCSCALCPATLYIQSQGRLCGDGEDILSYVTNHSCGD